MSWRNEPARHSLSARGLRSGIKTKGEKISITKMRKLSPMFKNKIIKEYKEGTNSVKLGEKYNLNSQTIMNWLKKRNIESKYEHQRHCSLNENFFSKITPKSAYVLGLWMADGQAVKKCYRIRFDQSEKEPLEKIQEVMESTYSITPYFRSKDKKIEYSVTLNSEQLYSDLEKLCPFNINQKSKNAKYPKISAKYDKDFIRGLFDGDGSIKNPKSNFSAFQISGSEKLLMEVRKRISKINGVSKGTLYKEKNKNCWRLLYNGNRQVKAIGNWLYKGANNLYLERKKKKFDELMVTSLQKKVNVTGG